MLWGFWLVDFECVRMLDGLVSITDRHCTFYCRCVFCVGGNSVRQLLTENRRMDRGCPHMPDMIRQAKRLRPVSACTIILRAPETTTNVRPLVVRAVALARVGDASGSTPYVATKLNRCSCDERL